MKMVVSRIEFRPVGQGAFIRRGQVKIRDFATQGAIEHLRWVYDCGADAKKEIIDASVHDLATDWMMEEALDVLVISHFDKDHISGLPTLTGGNSQCSIVRRIFYGHAWKHTQ